jgi:NAD(P)-dependent dehydrogenase (short-subunit alcohol dehydrogenase family)
MAEQTIFITGATGGLGSVVVPYFLDRGWRVIAVLSEENAKNKPESHPMLDVQVVDLTDERAVGTLISWLIQTYGELMQRCCWREVLWPAGWRMQREMR